MPRKGLMIAAVWTTLLCVPSIAEAQFLTRSLDATQSGRYSNYDPSESFTLQRIANSFPIDGPTVVNEIRWSGSFAGGSTPVTAPFRIRVFADAQGQPGTLVYEQSGTFQGVSTGFQTDSSSVMEYRSGAVLDLSLSGPSTYWISIAHDFSPAFIQFLWSRASTADGAAASTNSDTGPWKVSSPDRDCAFQLYQIPTAATQRSWGQLKLLYARP